MRRVPTEEYPDVPRPIVSALIPSQIGSFLILSLLLVQLGLTFADGIESDAERAFLNRTTDYGRIIAKHDLGPGKGVEVVVAFPGPREEIAAHKTMSTTGAESYRLGKHTLVSYPKNHPEQAIVGSLPTPPKKRPLPKWFFARFAAVIAFLLVSIIPKTFEHAHTRWLKNAQALPAHVVSRRGFLVHRIRFTTDDGKEATFTTLPFLHRTLVPGTEATLLQDDRGRTRAAESLWAIDLPPIT